MTGRPFLMHFNVLRAFGLERTDRLLERTDRLAGPEHPCEPLYDVGQFGQGIGLGEILACSALDAPVDVFGSAGGAPNYFGDVGVAWIGCQLFEDIGGGPEGHLIVHEDEDW